MITKCNNESCEKDCFRFKKESIENLNPENDSNCKHFWKNRHQPIKQIR